MIEGQKIDLINKYKFMFRESLLKGSVGIGQREYPYHITRTKGKILIEFEGHGDGIAYSIDDMVTDAFNIAFGTAKGSGWRMCRKRPVEVEFREPEGDEEKVQTLEGVEIAKKGVHYVIKGIKGELYPIKIEIFKETYELIQK
jgi:hypothetical protein